VKTGEYGDNPTFKLKPTRRRQRKARALQHNAMQTEARRKTFGVARYERAIA
jgi:hypothetical protein